jgi:hypothetical protein
MIWKAAAPAHRLLELQATIEDTPLDHVSRTVKLFVKVELRSPVADSSLFDDGLLFVSKESRALFFKSYVRSPKFTTANESFSYYLIEREHRRAQYSDYDCTVDVLEGESIDWVDRARDTILMTTNTIRIIEACGATSDIGLVESLAIAPERELYTGDGIDQEEKKR